MNLIKNKPIVISILIFLLVLVVYIIFAGRLKLQFPTDPANYFSHLSISLLNGRLDLTHPNWNHDLSVYQGKMYMYWGPTPILLILPLVIFFGVNISDALYTAIFSSLAPILIYLSLQKMEHLNFIRLSNLKKILLSLFFAFGTMYFAIAVKGGVWFTSQALSTLYILISIYFIFSYSASRKTVYLVLSSLFLGLGIWGRITFIFYIPLFLSLLFVQPTKKPTNKYYDSILIFVILSGILIINFLYNFLRFDSIIENGYSYQNPAPRYAIAKSQYGYFNLTYLPHNFYYNFIHIPTFMNEYPFIKFDPEGNSFLLLSPLFFFIFLIIRKKYWETTKLKIINGTIITSILLITFIELIFYGTGWFQFNARYLLDIIPLLILLLSQTLEDIWLTIIISLVIVSIFFNTLGALWLVGVFHG